MKFHKMQGTGNDFIVTDAFKKKLSGNLSLLAKKLCDRHFGIGADGLILVLPSKCADLKMRIFNPDGSEAEMCGNGIRCAVKYVYQKNIVRKKNISVETLAGIIITNLFIRKNNVYKVKVNMGKPKLAPADIPVLLEGEKIVNREIKLQDENIRINCVSMGNPHCVIFVKNKDDAPVKILGGKLENHFLFPKRTNVEFVEVVNKNNIKVRVWERGAGETLACGTGACASVVAGVLNNLLNRFVNVYLPGGKLQVLYNKDENIFLTGESKTVFEGEIVF